MKRNFCVPYFWTNEVCTKEIIRNRTKEYKNRIIFRLENHQSITFEEHLEQDIYVATNAIKIVYETENSLFREIKIYYLNNKHSYEYNKIFNFFYGDKEYESLGFKKYGMKDINGYDSAKNNCRKKNKYLTMFIKIGESIIKSKLIAYIKVIPIRKFRASYPPIFISMPIIGNSDQI